MALAIYNIPTSFNPQKFSISLAGNIYNITLRWIELNLAWGMDIADSNDVPILSGVPLITGADLLAQYEYLNFGGSIVVYTDYHYDLVPTFNSLGINGHLVFAVGV